VGRCSSVRSEGLASAGLDRFPTLVSVPTLLLPVHAAVPLHLLPLASPVQAVSDWAVKLMDTLGGAGAGIAIALENFFPPIPSEAILPLAGFAASQGTITLVEALIWTTAGSVVGALGLYALGALLGRRRTRGLLGKIPLVKVSDIDRGQEWFERHGSKAVFFGRMVPVVRSFISIPAGIERMPVLRFALLTSAGSAIWNTLFVVAGYQLGENWHVVERYAGIFEKVVLAAVVVAIAVVVVRRVREHRRTQAEDSTS
jgi:membrane protein DedA with SNARE-associated domain